MLLCQCHYVKETVYLLSVLTSTDLWENDLSYNNLDSNKKLNKIIHETNSIKCNSLEHTRK